MPLPQYLWDYRIFYNMTINTNVRRRTNARQRANKGMEVQPRHDRIF